MDEPLDIEIVRTEALKKLGRNIVNFSKIEGILKYLLIVTQIDRIDGLSTRNSLIENRNRFSKQTLGRLVHQFHNSILDDNNQSKTQSDFSEPGIFLSFKIIYGDPEFLNIQKQTLLEIVSERNKLIHQDLALFDTSSIEDYHELIALLDEQNPRLLDHLEYLEWILTSFRETLKEIQAVVKSTEFQLIHSSQSNS